DVITPIPTEFIYDSISQIDKYKLIGKTQESKYITAYDKVFEMDLNYFDKEASFTQKIEIIDPKLKSIDVEISFQACDDVRCIYQNKIVSLDLNNATLVSENISDYVENQNETVIKEKIEPVKVEGENKGLLKIFFTAFFLGFLVLLPPCVFPMIPMTVSFFTKQSKTRVVGIKNALLYGFFIIVIYTLLGTAISALFGSNAMYEFSTGVTFNAIMFIALMVFAFSFLGAFEIMLPNSWVNKVDSGANRGGVVGI